MPKVVEPLWESKSDLDQVKLVAEKMGVGQYFDKSADDYLKEILHIGDPNADGNVNGLTWEQLTGGTAYHLNTPTLPYVPFDTKEFPTKSGKIEFYVEMLLPFDQALCDYKEQIEATVEQSARQEVPADLPLHPHALPHPLAVLRPGVDERGHQQRRGLPGDQPGRRQGARALRRRRGTRLQRPWRDEGQGQAHGGDQAGRGQLLPGRLGHDRT